MIRVATKARQVSRGPWHLHEEYISGHLRRGQPRQFAAEWDLCLTERFLTTGIIFAVIKAQFF